VVLSKNLDPAYAKKLVDREMTERCMEGALSLEAGLAILRSIESRGGAAGIGARLASLRLTRKAAESGAAQSGVAVNLAPRSKARIRVREIVALLVGTLGPEKATATVSGALAEVGLVNVEVLDDEQAVLLLDHLAKIPTLMAIARFAKVRLLTMATRS
jgi:hypothetical protein